MIGKRRLIDLAQNRNMRWTFVKVAMDLKVP